jgi:hypothetical protein
MLETYPGILRDNRIEWSGEAPRQLPPGQPVRVHVTILEPIGLPASERGRRMAAALERLAVNPTPPSIPDPTTWQREMREDRPLPGRDG